MTEEERLAAKPKGGVLRTIGEVLGGATSATPLGAAANIAGRALPALAAAIPTAQSINNANEISNLRHKARSGEGLDARTRDLMYAKQMDPARRATTQLGNAYSAAAGRQPGSTAALAQQRRETMDAVGNASRVAGDRVMEADRAAAMANKAELEQRLAVKSARTTDMLNGIGSAFMDQAETAGKQAGEVPLDIYQKGAAPVAAAGASPVTPAVPAAPSPVAQSKGPPPAAPALPQPPADTEEDMARMEAEWAKRKAAGKTVTAGRGF